VSESMPSAWNATLTLVVDLRRASEPTVGARRRWQQTWGAAEQLFISPGMSPVTICGFSRRHSFCEDRHILHSCSRIHNLRAR
jgi:hypothetical protein